MSNDRLADLDELVLSCRTASAKRMIAEAIACYEAGAFRAAIVASWTAVVFDFLDKLHQLELDGDAQAKSLLEQFEKARQANDHLKATQLEEKVLNVARDQFELLSPLEFLDLERLHEDRHRCAHPSLLTLQEPYRPPAELVRCHIRNAVEHLLARPPVQGRAALERVWADIRSEYFPEDADAAETALRSGPLRRARDSLVTGVVVGLTKSLILDTLALTERSRQFAALVAVKGMYPSVMSAILREKLDSIVARVADDGWWKVIEYMAKIEVAWPSIGEARQAKAVIFLNNMPIGAGVEPTIAVIVIRSAMRLPSLKDAARTRLKDLPGAALGRLIRQDRLDGVAQAVVEEIENTRLYKRIADLRANTLSACVGELVEEDYRRLVAALTSNSAVRNYAGWESLCVEILEATSDRATQASDAWATVYNHAVKLRIVRRGETLRTKLVERLPELATIATPGSQQVESEEIAASPESESVSSDEDAAWDEPSNVLDRYGDVTF